MVSTTRRLSKVKRNFQVFRKPVILLALVLVMTGFLAYQASQTRQYTQIKEVLTQRQGTEGSGHTATLDVEAALLTHWKNQIFGIDGIMLSREATVKSIPFERAKVTNRSAMPQFSPKRSSRKEISDKKNQEYAETKENKKQDTQLKATKGQNDVGKRGSQMSNLGIKGEEAKRPLKTGSEKQFVGEKINNAKEQMKLKEQNTTAVDKRQNVKNTIRLSNTIEEQKGQNVAFNAPEDAARKAEETQPRETEQQKKVVVQSNQRVDQPGTSTVKYLIYLCDRKAHCYGLGDRQRAIVATYYLAELTGRRFGLIMTAPANIRDFYEPNLVKWDITESELPKNATRFEISALGPKVNLHLDTIDFNTEYPQDVVYVRTNQIFWFATLKNPIYKEKVPGWARMHHSFLIAAGWLRLMKPTPLLRASLNSALVDVAMKIQEEAEVAKVLGKGHCCEKLDLPKVLPSCSKNQTICMKNMTVQKCCDAMAEKMFAYCPELRTPCSRVDSKACEKKLSLHDPKLSLRDPKLWDEPRIRTLAHNYCAMPPSVSKLNNTVDAISRKKGFDLTDMNLVCAHIRLGHSKTFPFENHSFNKQQGVSGVWEFLRRYAEQGYHMYLASDAQEVKDEAKSIFGDRLHMADKQIVHIAFAQKGQDLKAGLQFTLTEQLLLTTACREIVISHSGYSGRAVEIRNRLMGGKAGRVYHYHDGIVT